MMWPAAVAPGDVMNAVDSVMLRPWDWARGHHCLGDVAEVLRRLGGPDIMFCLRGRYDTKRGALRIVSRAGGLLALVEAECARAGMTFGPAVPGAVGVVETGGRDAVVICLRAGLWAGKTQEGFAVIDVELQGWSWSV